MKVRRLPTDPGPAGWLRILPERAPAPALEGRRAFDILIVGAGFAGLSAARGLHQIDPKTRIALVEARGLAEGPAGRNSGFMIDLPHNLSSSNYAGGLERDQQQTRMNRHAIRFAAEAADDYKLTAEAFDPCGKINAAASEKGDQHNHDYAQHLTSIGEECELLDARDMARICGSDYYRGGLYTKGTAMLQPALYIRGLADGLRRDGVELFENSPVTSLRFAGDAWNAETPNGAISAAKVILANNGHVESFGHFKRRLVHIYLFASMSAPLDSEAERLTGAETRWGFTPSDSFGTTMRKISGTGGTRLVVRNGIKWAPGQRAKEGDVARLIAQHDVALAARYPKLAGLKMDYRWGGQLCLSLNTVPAFGQIDQGMYAACCQNGLGTAQGTLAGMAIADLIHERDTQELRFMQDHDAPRLLPPEPIATIGAKARFWWGERAAGAEL
ncbi:MAG: FAD-binding oxidoreductase [Pseudomonadota bacterium]